MFRTRSPGTMSTPRFSSAEMDKRKDNYSKKEHREGEKKHREGEKKRDHHSDDESSDDEGGGDGKKRIYKRGEDADGDGKTGETKKVTDFSSNDGDEIPDAFQKKKKKKN